MALYVMKHLITLRFLFIKSPARILQPVRITRASVNLDLPVQPAMSSCPVTKCVETMALVISRERRKCVFAAKASPEVSASTHSISAPNRKYKPGISFYPRCNPNRGFFNEINCYLFCQNYLADSPYV